MSRSSSCARALSRATLARRGWGHWSSNARCDHRDRRSFSSSSLKILCPLGLDLVSFVFARRVRYSISLSLSFIRSRERSLIPKGHSTKTTKITLKGIETTFPRRGRVTTTLETVPTDLSRFRAPSTPRCLFPFTRDNFGSNPNPNRIERAFASVVRAPKTVKTTTPFLRFKANKNPLSNNNVFLPVTDACCVLSQRERKREKDTSGQINIMNWTQEGPTAADSTLVVRRSRVRRGCRTARTHRLVSPFTHDDDGSVLFFALLKRWWWWCSFERKKSEAFLECIGVPNMRQEKKAKEYERPRTRSSVRRWKWCYYE